MCSLGVRSFFAEWKQDVVITNLVVTMCKGIVVKVFIIQLLSNLAFSLSNPREFWQCLCDHTVAVEFATSHISYLPPLPPGPSHRPRQPVVQGTLLLCHRADTSQGVV